MSQIIEKSTTSDDEFQSTVLCVDDEANILSALRRLLRPKGYKLLFAQNGEEGLAVMEKENVDLVLSDMRMPVMDGAKFLTEVAARWPDTMRILLTGYADMTATIDAINKGQIFKYISKPWEDNDILISIERALQLKNLEQERLRLQKLSEKQNEELTALNESLEFKVKQRTAEIEQTLGMYESVNDELKNSYSTSIEVFANLVSMRKGYERSDIRRLPEVARAMATELEQSEMQAQDIYHAALLREIGLLSLPDSLLSKPLSSLSSVNQKRVLKHAVIGQGVLMALEPLQGVAYIIRCQNERFDGKGYPDGLVGEKIPLGSRILKVLNDFYGLQNGTITDRKFSASEARDLIKKEKGNRYDPDVVDAFSKIVRVLNDSDKLQKEVMVKSNGLEPGMILSRDLASEGGVMLLSKGYLITEEVIDRVDSFERSIDEDLIIYVVVNADTAQ